MNGPEAITIASTLWSYQDGVFEVQTAGAVSVWPADARRVTLVFQTQGPDAVLIAFRPVVNTQGAIFIWPGQRPTVLTFREYGPIVQQEVFAIPFGTAGNATLQSFNVYRNT